MHPKLKKLIEEGERRLAEVTDPAERERLAAQLQSEIARIFTPSEPQPETSHIEVSDGAHIGEYAEEGDDDDDDSSEEHEVEDESEPEDVDRDEYVNHGDFASEGGDQRSANEMVEGGCYSTEEDCDGDPKGGRGGTRVRAQSFSGITSDLRKQRIIANHGGYDAVDYGDVMNERWEERMGGRCFKREGGAAPADGRATPKKDYSRVCLLCKQEFKGTENAQWCDDCKQPRWAYARRQYRADEGIPESAPGSKPDGRMKYCLRCGKLRGKGRFCTPNCRKRYTEENLIVKK